MLKGLDPLLGPELLATLRRMGHGEEIALVDANFPAHAAGLPVIRLDGIGSPRALQAVVSVMPLDDFTEDAAWCMQIVGDPTGNLPIFDEFRAILAAAQSPAIRLASLERFAFYDRARGAAAIVATGETRLYGNILLKKGVVRPD